MRIAAVVLPELMVEIAQRDTGDASPSCTHSCTEGSAPPLVVVRTADESFGEANITGGTRITAVSSSAASLGIRPGDTVSSARMKESALVVRVVHDAAVRRSLEAVADVAMRFGATVSLAMPAGSGASGGTEPEATWALPCVWVDTTGCARLFGDSIESGEPRALHALASAVGGLGHVCAVAMASGPRIARGVATALAFTREPSREREGEAARPQVLHLQPRREREVVARLPLEVFPLGPEDVRFFRQLGVARVGDLARISRASLGTRLGEQGANLFLLADGIDRAPLVRYEPPPEIRESVELDHAAHSRDALVFVMKTLADRMSGRLVGRGLAASRFVVTYTFDDAFVGGRGKRHAEESLALVEPEQRGDRILAPLRAKIEALTDEAPVLAVSLAATHVVHHQGTALGLLEGDIERQEKARARNHVMGELLAELGETNVGMLTASAEWQLGDRFVAGALRPVALLAQGSAKRRASPRKRAAGQSALHAGQAFAPVAAAGAPETAVALPTRLLAEPVPLRDKTRDKTRDRTSAQTGDRVGDKPASLVRFLFRLEATAWWKEKTAPSAADYLMMRVDTKMACVGAPRSARDGARSEPPRVLGWFD